MSLKPPLPPNTLLDYRHVYDEGTQQTAEDGINFTGAGVTVTDDPANHRLVVTIPGGTVGTGDEPYTVVDGLSGTPRSVTDWGALINTAIVNGSRRFLFGAFDYPFTTMIDGRQYEGIIFQGAAGWDWYDAGRTNGTGDTGHSRLIWNGTGTGYAIDFSSATTGPGGNTGPVLEDLMLLYSSGSYTGKLVNYANSTMCSVRRCYFGSVQSSHATAAAALLLAGVNTIDVSNTTFGPDFVAAVRGRDATGPGYSNVARFHECTFQGGGAGIVNPGLDWLCDHCDFEFPSLTGTSMITTDYTYGAGDQITLTLRDCAYWDAIGGTQKVVYAPAGNFWGLTARDCHDHGQGFSRIYDMQSTGAIVIDGGSYLNPIDVGDGNVAASRKRLVRIVGADIYSSSTATGMVLNVNTGHAAVEVDNLLIGRDSSLGVSGQVRTVSHERVQRVDHPSIALHTAVTNLSFGLFGSDMTGFIVVTNTAGVASPTGLLLDITLAAPACSTDLGSGVNTGNELPLVNVFPFQADDGGANFTTGNMASTWASQFYGSAKSLRNGGSQGTWSLGANVGIPAGATICVGYRVIHL